MFKFVLRNLLFIVSSLIDGHWSRDVWERVPSMQCCKKCSKWDFPFFMILTIWASPTTHHPQFLKMVETRLPCNCPWAVCHTGGFSVGEFEQASVPSGRMRAVPRLLKVPNTSHWHLPQEGDMAVIRYSLWRVLRHVHLFYCHQAEWKCLDNYPKTLLSSLYPQS